MSAITKGVRSRSLEDWQPRLSAIQIVDDGNGWAFQLTGRATVFEVTLLRLAYGAAIVGVNAPGLLVRPAPGHARPTREQLAERLAHVKAVGHGR